MVHMQTTVAKPFKTQLLKWIGNKQRMAGEITSFFPRDYDRYVEPFLGSAAILGTLAPDRALASDILPQLMGIWDLTKDNPDRLVESYAKHRDRIDAGADKKVVYQDALDSYNARPNPDDFVFLTRACYGGVIRFRKADGGMSTPCGAHMPVSTASFRKRVAAWHERVQGTEFRTADFRETFKEVGEGDLVYCDPPYVDSQKILYGAQSFVLSDLVAEIAAAKERGARIALSLDGSKRSGLHEILHDFPDGLFEYEVAVTVGRSHLLRFQREGQSLEQEVVRDRLLLTYPPEMAEEATLF